MHKGRGEERKGEINGKSRMDVSTPKYVNSQPMGICCVTRGTHAGALGQPGGAGENGRWEGGSRRRGCMFTYGQFMLMCDGNQTDIINLSSIN